MKNNYPFNSNTIINCINCHNKLRVPVDKGKISVACPVCKKEFVYNPNSIIDTIKQIRLSFISGISRLPKTKRNRIALLLAAFILIITLFFLFFGKVKPENIDKIPGSMVYDSKQEYLKIDNANNI